MKAFRKVYLKAGECRTVSLTIPLSELRYWHPGEHRWAMEPGIYSIQLCSDCQTVLLNKSIELEGEALPSVCDADVMAIYRLGDFSKLTDALYEKLSGGRIPTEPPKLPITTESRFTDLKQTFIGRILFNAVLSVADKQKKKAETMPDGMERDNAMKGALFLRRILESNSVRSMSMSAGKSMPWHIANGFVYLANCQMIKGIKSFLSPVKVPKLPKEE